MIDSKIVLTKDGLKELQAEFHDLSDIKRPVAVERLAQARSEGDLAENSEYSAAKQDLSFIDGRIAELKQIIAEAKVISSHSKKKVDVGCKVTLHIGTKKEIFTIVGEWEADPTQKKISHSSPLGKALLGKKPGDKIEVEAPAGLISYKILHIE